MNAIEAQEASRKGRLKALQEDIKAIEQLIKDVSDAGVNRQFNYDLKTQWSMEFVAAHFLNLGFKVKHKRLFHSGYNTIEVSWK